MSYEANKSIDKIIELAKAILNIEVDLVKNLQNYIKHYLYKHGDRGKTK